jgi:hypothetical protein
MNEVQDGDHWGAIVISTELNPEATPELMGAKRAQLTRTASKA